MKHNANAEQSALWNGPSGSAWVDEQALLDQTYAPFAALLAETAATQHARRVLDIGCGSGATTLAVARTLGADGSAQGIDISQPLIARARERATRDDSTAQFLCADAQTHEFAPASFDLLVSRFGVMFFEDPVAAFANLLYATRAGGELRCIAFRPVTENPFMTTAERATAPLLPNLPPRQPDAPGQFAFADRQRVERILDAAGWKNPQLAPLDVPCAFPERDLVRFFTRFGPVGLVLREADEATRARIIGTLRAAFAPFIESDEVRFVAACWMISAQA
jgi:SAM-dependent methyltransferase